MKALEYLEIDYDALRKQHDAQGILVFNLNSVRGLFFIYWYKGWVRLKDAVVGQSLTISGFVGYIQTVIFGLIAKLFFPKLVPVMTYVGHFRANCIWSSRQGGVQFKLVPSKI